MDRPTILIVDDEVEIIKSLSAILEEEFHILATSNSLDVRSILETNALSLLILDLKMPEMTGLELIEAIRSVDNETPILVVTGCYGQEQDKRFADLDVQGCIKKPLDIEMLMDRIDMILKTAL